MQFSRLKRQTALDWTPLTLKVRKAKSLSDTHLPQGTRLNKTEPVSCDENSKSKTKKKKKKKAKTSKKIKGT